MRRNEANLYRCEKCGQTTVRYSPRDDISIGWDCKCGGFTVYVPKTTAHLLQIDGILRCLGCGRFVVPEYKGGVGHCRYCNETRFERIYAEA